MERSRKYVYAKIMSGRVIGNYLRTHRRKSGLSQRELGILLGYQNQHQVSRHERSKSAPPLLAALAYEIVFQVPVAQLFPGFQSAVAHSVARNLREFKKSLEDGTSRQLSKASLQKLQWLAERNIA